MAKRTAKHTGSSDGAGDDLVYPGIQAERVSVRTDDDQAVDGRYVLYWMQQSVRAVANHALEYAIRRAGALDLPVVVAFALVDDYPDANARHYRFLLEGLRDVAADLDRRKITFVVRRGTAESVIPALAKSAALVVFDRGYLRHQRQWRDAVQAKVSGTAVVEVESDAVVPVETASDHAEYGARTIRPKINDQLDRFLVPLPRATVKNTTRPRVARGEDVSTVDALLRRLAVADPGPGVDLPTGGTRAGRRALTAFLRTKLGRYDDSRDQPHLDIASHLSSYLHFGHISSLLIALAARDKHRGTQVDAFCEELIVRRELAFNFVHYTTRYDAYACIPDWAKDTLSKHGKDKRDPRYTKAQLEAAETDDEYWNAAMTQMKLTGYLHNHLRMYWGKKIIEWSSSPQAAYRTALELNNTWFLDGRDANSYANVGWLFGVHDRGWTEREILGTVRWMSAGGLKRKADMPAYLEQVEKLRRRAED